VLGGLLTCSANQTAVYYRIALDEPFPVLLGHVCTEPGQSVYSAIWNVADAALL
jgi:hypothetical protein